MEGVMMRGKKSYSLAVRAPDKSIKTMKRSVKASAQRHPVLRLPVLRGIINFGSSLVMGIRVIYDSADMAGLSDLKEENPSRFEKWLEDRFGDKLFDVIMYFSVVLSLCLSIGLFMLLPVWVSSFLNNIIGDRKWILSISEGLLRMAIFIGYLYLMTKMKEIRRVFEFHGAEHKTINCYESGGELTVADVRKHPRQHTRCGTSFLLIVMLVSMVVFFFVRVENIGLRLLSRLLLVPVIAGISYELIMWAGRSKSPFVRVFSAPGIWLQKLTTGEPDDEQIEVAIEALYGVLEDDGVVKRRREPESGENEASGNGDRDGGAGCGAADDESGGIIADGAGDEARESAEPGTEVVFLEDD